MQSPGPLNDQVDGCKIRNHRIEVDIQRLLDNLCRYQYLPSAVGIRTLLPEPCEHIILDLLTISNGEPGVEEFDVSIAPSRSEALVCLDRVDDGIPDPAGAPAFPKSPFEVGLYVRLVAGEFNRNSPPGERICLHRPLLYASGGNYGHQGRVGLVYRHCRHPEAGAVSGNEPLPEPDRKRRREQDCTAPKSRVKLEQPLKKGIHVLVVGMHLVHNEHMPGEAEQAERLVVERQHGDECLVYGADTDIGEEGFLPVIREPGIMEKFWRDFRA